MSLKDNIKMVRQELNSEEKFFEKAVMTERFVKKYKTMLIGTFVVIVVAVAVNLFYSANKSAKASVANEALIVLKDNPADEKALQELKENAKGLYELWNYSQAVAIRDIEGLKELKGSSSDILSDLAKYESATTLKELESYAKNESGIYRDLALVQSAILLMEEGKIEKAHQKLRTITLDSPIAEEVSALLHYGVK